MNDVNIAGIALIISLVCWVVSRQAIWGLIKLGSGKRLMRVVRFGFDLLFGFLSVAFLLIGLVRG